MRSKNGLHPLRKMPPPSTTSRSSVAHPELADRGGRHDRDLVGLPADESRSRSRRPRRPPRRRPARAPRAARPRVAPRTSPPSPDGRFAGRSARGRCVGARFGSRARRRRGWRAQSACPAELAGAAPVSADRADRRQPERRGRPARPRCSSFRSRRRCRRPRCGRCRREARRRCRCAGRARRPIRGRARPRPIRRSSTGRSAPARQKTPRSATGCGDRRRARRRRHAAPDRLVDRLEEGVVAGPLVVAAPATRAAPSTVPSRRSSAASIFEPPPSTASNAGRLTAAPRARRSRTNVAPASARPSIIGAIASPVPPGQVCSSTTAPSPWAVAPATASAAIASPVRHGSQSSSSTCQCTLR